MSLYVPDFVAFVNSPASVDQMSSKFTHCHFSVTIAVQLVERFQDFIFLSLAYLKNARIILDYFATCTTFCPILNM